MTGYERAMYADISRISETLKQIRDSLKVIADAAGENETRLTLRPVLDCPPPGLDSELLGNQVVRWVDKNDLQDEGYFDPDTDDPVKVVVLP